MSQRNYLLAFDLFCYVLSVTHVYYFLVCSYVPCVSVLPEPHLNTIWIHFCHAFAAYLTTVGTHSDVELTKQQFFSLMRLVFSTCLMRTDIYVLS